MSVDQERIERDLVTSLLAAVATAKLGGAKPYDAVIALSQVCAYVMFDAGIKPGTVAQNAFTVTVNRDLADTWQRAAEAKAQAEAQVYRSGRARRPRKVCR